MNKRKFFNVLIIVTNITLIVLFFAFAKSIKSASTGPESCSTKCVRFCDEADRASIQDVLDLPEIIANISLVHVGKPCDRMKVLDNATEMTFSANGSIFVNETTVPVNYCLQITNETRAEEESGFEGDSSAGNTSKVEVLICENQSEPIGLGEIAKWIATHRFVIYLSLTLTTIGILGLIFSLYALINELKDVHGRFVLGFVFSLIVACASSQTLDGIGSVVVKIALISAFLWINVMIFNVWWTLSFFHTSSGGKFKYYGYYVLGFGGVVLATMAVFYENVNTVAYIFLGLVVLICLACFIFAAMKIYEMTGVDIDFGTKRFTHEENRFITYLQLFTITTVTWFIEMCTWEFIGSNESLIIAHFLVCVHSLLIFIILVLKKKARDVIIRNVCCC